MFSPTPQPGWVKKYTTNPKKFIGWGPPVKKQPSGFSRKKGELLYKFIDVARFLEKRGWSLWVFPDSEKRPRKPTPIELMAPIFANETIMISCQNGHYMRRRVDHTMEGRCCLKCPGHMTGKYKESLVDLQVYAAKNGGKCLSDSYHGVRGRYDWECAYGHKWDTIWHSMKKSNSWCPRCADRINGENRRKAR
jgi:hypothetical protein